MLRAKKRYIVLFVTPAFIFFLTIFALPILTVFLTSFTKWNKINAFEFICFDNYIRLFTNDSIFTAALFNTLKWILLQCSVTVGLGLAITLLTQNGSRFSRFVRVVYIIPNVISMSALAMLFYFIFHPMMGIVNSFIRLLGFNDFHQNWYFEPDTSFLAVTLTTILFAGILSLLFSARISSIPQELYEAATVDGASKIRIAFTITIPLTKGAISTAMILSAAGCLKAFEVIYLTTNGGPGAMTMNLSLYLYNLVMRSDRFGYGNAVGVVIIVLGILSLVIIRKLIKDENIW